MINSDNNWQCNIIAADSDSVSACRVRFGHGKRVAAGQCTLTGENSFCRATTKAWARSGTSASTCPVGAWMA